MNHDEKVIDSAQQYGAELAPPRIVSGFAARALPVGSVLVRAQDGRPVPGAHAVVRVHGGWWSADAPNPEPLAGDLWFLVLLVPGEREQVRPVVEPRLSWRGRTFLTGARRSFADGPS